ncbi:hypothetical protein ACQ4PT_016875 [Festuca glaucescens]
MHLLLLFGHHFLVNHLDFQSISSPPKPPKRLWGAPALIFLLVGLSKVLFGPALADLLPALPAHYPKEGTRGRRQNGCLRWDPPGSGTPRRQSLVSRARSFSISGGRRAGSRRINGTPSGWRLSAGGIPIPPEPRGNARAQAMHQHFYGELTSEQRVDPHWDLENAPTWDSFFRQRRLFKLSRYEGNGPPPANNNAAARRIWWGALGRTLAAVLEHIAYGNEPPLEFPAIQGRWTPRRMATVSSSSSSGSRASSAATPRSGGGLYIREAPSAGARRPKREDGGSGSSRPKKPKAEEPEWTPPEEYRAGQLLYAAAETQRNFRGRGRRSWRRSTTPCRRSMTSRWRGRGPRPRRRRLSAHAASASSSSWTTRRCSAVGIPAKAAAAGRRSPRTSPRTTAAPTRTTVTTTSSTAVWGSSSLFSFFLNVCKYV